MSRIRFIRSPRPLGEVVCGPTHVGRGRLGGEGHSPIRFLLAATLILAAGCARQKDPVAAAQAYFDAFARGDYGAQYRMLSARSWKVEGRAAFIEHQAQLASRRRLVKAEIVTKAPKDLPDPWRVLARLQWETAAGRKESTWRGLTVVRSGGGWEVADTPSARQAANESYMAGESTKATKMLQAILRANPADAEALDLMGYVLRDNPLVKNNLDLAVDVHRQAVELEPRNPDWHLSLGNDYRLLGWYSGAVSELRKAVDLDPRANYYAWLGVAYAAGGNLDSARSAWHTAIRMDPNNAQAHACLEKTR